MKNLLNILTFAMLCFLLFSACEKDESFRDDIQLLSYTFEPSSNEGLLESVTGVIEGRDVYIRVPNSIDISQAVPSFTINSDKMVAYVGKQVMQSGETAIDLSQDVTYRFSTPSSLSEYIVHAMKSGSFLTFGFYAEDNPGVLFRDYLGTINKLDVQVDLPVDADITSLVARFTTTDGATVTSGGDVLVSQITALDYSEDVSLALQDAEMTDPEVFVVHVGRLTAPVWSRVQLPDFLGAVNASASTMAINPVTQQPYVMIQLGSSLDSKAVVGAYAKESNTWNSLGDETGFTPGRVDAIAMTFDSQGTPYVVYKDYESTDNVQYGSVQRYQNGTWNYVAEQQFTYSRVNYISIQTDAEDVPYVGYIFARASSPYANRTTAIQRFDGTAWAFQTLMESTTGYWSKMFKGRDGKLYYATMDLTAGAGVRKPSIYRLSAAGTWQLVGHTHVGPSTSNSGGFNIDLDATEDGQVYMVYQSNSPSYATYVMHWDGATWSQLGDGFAQTTSSSANRDNVALKIHPDGRIFLAFGDAENGIKITTFNTETQNWNTPVQISAENGNKYEMCISDEGIPYLTTVIDGNVVLFKYDIPGL